MKTCFKNLLIYPLFIWGCSTSYMAGSFYEDDIYYDPGSAPLLSKNEKVGDAPVHGNVYSTYSQQSKQNLENISLNQNYLSDDRDFSGIQQKYAKLDSSDYQKKETGYYLGGFTGDEYDKEEAQRFREMYPQGFGAYDGSGYSLAMWLAHDNDWNVYVDGHKVWWTPTWTNNSYYDFFNFNTMRYGNYFVYDYPFSTHPFLDYHFHNHRYDYPRWNIGFSWNSCWNPHSYWTHRYDYCRYPYFHPHHNHHGGHYYGGGKHHHGGGYYGSNLSGYRTKAPYGRRPKGGAGSVATSNYQDYKRTKTVTSRSNNVANYRRTARRSYPASNVGTNNQKNSIRSTYKDRSQRTVKQNRNVQEVRTGAPTYNRTKTATRPSYNSSNRSSSRSNSGFSGGANTRSSSYTRTRVNSSSGRSSGGTTRSSSGRSSAGTRRR